MTVQAMMQRPIKGHMVLSDIIASRAYNDIVSSHIMLLTEYLFTVCGHMCHIVGKLRYQDLREESKRIVIICYYVEKLTLQAQLCKHVRVTVERG